MERILSEEEKIRRAIEISQRRNNNYRTTTSTARVNVNQKKDYKLFRKIIIQIIICLLIYLIFHLIASTNYVFSADIIKSTNEILNYDIDFNQMYHNLMLFITSQTTQNQVVEQNNILTNEQVIQDNNEKNETLTNINNNDFIQEENTIEKEETEEIDILGNEKKEYEEEIKETSKTQEELDVEAAKKVCKFKKPLNGTITSEFGEREATIEGMTTNHKGIDIAANSGTSIKSAIDGRVVVADENSEYGKFIKIVNDDVMTVYAHCKTLKVKVGDKIKIGQTIATVGSTGKSTGPHLHFEIRYENRFVNPRLLIEF